MTDTTTPAIDSETIGPLSLKEDQQVWVIVGETPKMLYVRNFPDFLGKYVLKENTDKPSMPYYRSPEMVYLDEKSAWVVIEASIMEARQELDSKLATIAHRISEL